MRDVAIEDLGFERAGLTDLVSGLLAQLLEREEAVLRAYYGIGMRQLTMAEIGKGLGVTRSRVRQIRKRGERRLREIFSDYE